MQDLHGKVAVVTGAASGIGLAYAEAFAHAGMHVVLADVELHALEEATQRIGAIGNEVLAVPTDVTDAGAVEQLAETTMERFGAVHVVCNNAGVGGTAGTTWETSLPAWRWVLDVNLWGVIHGIRAFVPRLIDQGEGHVVNTASAAAFATVPFMGPYCATKHAVLAISEALQQELAMVAPELGVTAVCPGFVRTRIAESERNWPSERLGPPPERDEGMTSIMKSLIDAGVEPATLASTVVDAVRTRRFLVSTDESLITSSLAGRQALLDGAQPAISPLL